MPAVAGVVLEKPPLGSIGIATTLDRIGVRSGQRILKTGPGPGRVLITAARRVLPFGEAVGIDIRAGMIDRLHERAARAGVTNVVAIVGDASKTLPPGQFDIVILAHVLGEIPNRDAALAGCFPRAQAWRDPLCC